MPVFDEIEVMQGLVRVLSPLLQDDLGVLVTPTGVETAIPAILLADTNSVPSATYPRITISYQGSVDQQLTQRKMREEPNPLYPEDPTAPEYLYYDDLSTHIQYTLLVTVDSGDMDEVLRGDRKSPNYIQRKIRQLFKSQTVRDRLHAEMESGVATLSDELPVRDQFGTLLMGSSNMILSFTYLDTYSELLDAVASGFTHTSKLYRGEDDTDPLEGGGTVED